MQAAAGNTCVIGIGVVPFPILALLNGSVREERVTLAAGIRLVVPSLEAAMESRASIAGHPIHPMLVAFPIGLFVFSFIADLIHLGTGDAVWSNVAYYTIAGGIVGGIAAAVPGAMDLFALPQSRARSIGMWHMTINLVVVALFIIGFWLRSGAAADAAGPVWLSLIGVALLGVSGWLGGEMVYVHGVGHGHEHGTSVPRARSEHARPQPSRH